jgi:hypothetical protein
MMKTKRGIAIISTLIVASLLMMLAAVFLKMNDTSFSLGSRADKNEIALQAAQTGIEYARMRLETDSNWGVVSALPKLGSRSGGLEVVEIENLSTRGGESAFVSVGILHGGDSHFQIVFPQKDVNAIIPSCCFKDEDIEKNPRGGTAVWGLDTLGRDLMSVNNFFKDGRSYTSAIRESSDSTPGRAIPANRAVIQAIGYHRGVRRVIEVVYRPELLTKSTFSSGGNTAVQSNATWGLTAVTGERADLETRGNLFLPHDTRDSDPNSAMVRNLTGRDGKAASQAAIKTGGRFTATLDDSTGTANLNWTTAPLDPSNFKALGDSMGQMSATQNTAVPPLKKPSIELIDQLLNNRRSKTITLSSGTIQFVNRNTALLLDASGKELETSVAGAFKSGLTVNNYRLEVPDGVRLNVEGNFSIQRGSSVQPPPALALGYEDGLLKSPARSKGASVNVQNGALTVDGSIVGNGSVVVNSTATSGESAAKINVTANSKVSGAQSSGVALYADGNIRVAAPKPEDAINYPADWNVVGKALDRYASASGRWGQIQSQWLDRNTGSQKQLDMIGEVSSSDSRIGVPALRRQTAPNVATAVTELAEQFNVASWPEADIESLTTGLQTVLGSGFSLTKTGVKMVAASPQPISVTDYLRVRAYMRDSKVNIAEGHPVGVVIDEIDDKDANNQLANEITWFAKTAREINDSKWWQSTPLDEFCSRASNPLDQSSLRNCAMEGMIYSNSSVLLSTGGGNLELLGSLLAGKDLVVTDTGYLRSSYDPRYIQEFSKFKVGTLSGDRLGYDFYREK